MPRQDCLEGNHDRKELDIGHPASCWKSTMGLEMFYVIFVSSLMFHQKFIMVLLTKHEQRSDTKLCHFSSI